MCVLVEMAHFGWLAIFTLSALISLSRTSGNESKHEDADSIELGVEVEAALETAPLARTEPAIVLQAWSVFARRAPIWANKWVNSIRGQLQAIVNKTSISAQCRQSLFATLSSIQQLDEWAIKRE